MSKYSPLILFLFVSLGAFPQERFYHYPTYQRSDYTETKFGLTVADPYKKLEDISSDSTKQWLKAQDKLIDGYRRSIFGKYQVCEREIAWNTLDFLSTQKNPFPHKTYGYYFVVRHNPSREEDAPVIYYKSDYHYQYDQLCPTSIFKTDKKDKLFVRGIEMSEDHKYVAILLSHSGSDWLDIRIRDVQAQSFLPDRIPWAKFDHIVWRGDGFFYSRFDEPGEKGAILSKNKNQTIYYHRLGDDVSKDKEILRLTDQDFSHIIFNNVESLHRLILYYDRTEDNKRVTVAGWLDEDSIDNGIHEFIKVAYDGTSPFRVIAASGNKYLVQSTYRAINGRVMVYDPNGLNQGQQVVEMYNQPLRQATYINSRIFCIYYDKGKYIPIIFDSLGSLLKKIDVPAGFGVSGFTIAINDSITLYQISSFEYFPRSVGFNTKSLSSIIYDERVGQLFGTGYTTKLIFFRSKDSVEVPMYIIYKGKTVPDSATPALMYAYGGFDISLGPRYNPGFRMFMEEGGIVAVPLVRGGGELGEGWHKGGMRLNKQKSFDDFISAAEYLIANKYTSPEHLAINGGSNGGLLVGAAMVQRPDLFKVVTPEAGVFDLLHFAQFSSGSLWIGEYGDPDDSLEYLNLYKLSPLQRLKKDVAYPATMIRVSDHDDWVVPVHGYKFIAALQNDTKSKIEPYLMYNIENQGHSMEGTVDDLQQQALMYAFIFENLGMDITALYGNK